ncbi:MAG: DUF2207 domain-containing protein [Candidatus Izemoplasmatales bacterium]|nr:DUF2207 domain-containing protein [Candidatus Izemoplasmatales bacterium]
MKNVRVILNIIVFIIFGFFYLGGSLESCSSESFFASVAIERYDADITIDESGDMTVIETWDMNYYEEMSVRFRDVEFKKYGDGYTLSIKPQNTASFDETVANIQVFKNDQDITSNITVGYSFENDLDEYGNYITCDPISDTCESMFADVTLAGGLDGQVTFVSTYKIIGAITEYSDISELNWRLFEYMEGTIKNSTVTVNLPVNSHPVDDVLAWGHGLSKGTISIPTNDKIVMNMEDITTDEFIEFRILAPTDLFPNVDVRNIFIDDEMNKATLVAYEAELAAETNLRITIAEIIFYASIGMTALMVIITLFVYKKYDKEYLATFTGDYYRELPSDSTPAEMSYLYYMKKTNDEDLTATLLDLIRKKYITIDYSGQDLTSDAADFQLQLNQEADLSKLLDHEKHVITWFFNSIGGDGKVSTKQIEAWGKKDYAAATIFEQNAKKFVRLVRSAGEKHNYFENAFASGVKKAYLFAFIPGAMIISALITQGLYILNNTLAIIISAAVLISYLIYVSTIKRRTVAGNEEFVKWKAFRNFLENFGNMKDYPIPGVAVWEHYLVYATSLKCASKVMSQLKIRLPETDLDDNDATFMRSGYRGRGFYYGYAFGYFSRSISIARTNARQTIVAYNQSRAGGFGKGGGFGGGSSFGGGGGGGRSR